MGHFFGDHLWTSDLCPRFQFLIKISMKKKNAINQGENMDPIQANNEMNDLDEIIRRKNIQNKVLKELIDQLKKYPVNSSKK